MNTKIETLPPEYEKIVNEIHMAAGFKPNLKMYLTHVAQRCAALRQADQQAQPQAIPTKQMLWAGTEAFRELVNGAEVDNPALHIFERMIAASQKERGK